MGRAVLNWLVILFQKSKLRVKEKHKQNLKSVLKFSSCGSVSLIFSFLTLAFYDHLSFPVWFTALNMSDTHLKVQNKSCKMETLETIYHHNDFLRDIPPPLACQQIGLTHTPGLSQTQQIQGPHQSKPLSPSLNLKSMSISSSTRETRTVDHLACSLPHLGIPWLPIPLLILLSLENWIMPTICICCCGWLPLQDVRVSCLLVSVIYCRTWVIISHRIPWLGQSDSIAIVPKGQHF